jgi:hypothetical protein
MTPESSEEQQRIETVAAGMLKRYRTPKIAREMAYDHAMEHEPNSKFRIYWLRVYETIIALSPDIKL